MFLRSFIQPRLRRTSAGEDRAAERFRSPEPIPHRIHGRIVQWMLIHRPRPPRRDENEFRPCRNAPVEPGQWEAVTINHATVLIRLHGLNVLTPPVWSDRVSPVSWMSPKRQRPSGIPWEALLQIDAVLISHNHDDHVDAPTLKRLEKRFPPLPRCRRDSLYLFSIAAHKRGFRSRTDGNPLPAVR